MLLISYVTLLLTLCSKIYAQDELRMGISQNDWKGIWKHKHEKGVALNFEYLVRLWDIGLGKYIFSPRPHMGMSISTHSGTTQLYIGLTWRINYNSFFLEPTFGGEIHNGHIKYSKSQKKALGTRFLFRESISIGYQISEKHSLSIMLDHASNCGNAKPNGGMNTLGIRCGYKI